MRHKWMAFLPFELTPEDARRMSTGEGLPSVAEKPHTELARGEAPPPDDPRPWFGLHNVVQELVSVGCYICEQAYSDEAEAAGCPGDPEGRSADELLRPGSPGTIPPAAGFTSVGRNDPCPCGSGQKFKRCHGRTP